ncbi:hypothetical protein BDV40DRAFT_275493 [Aspergillus tamarii]|uniref:Uncharacterized protein n=1 Tax=Aspergillus tamarii TaxID=41984 RepID=A0A5N6UK84_ASPTM|nr:hypothetical protein BDV40DRAFT_275493 [Aspergillus tamarii]
MLFTSVTTVIVVMLITNNRMGYYIWFRVVSRAAKSCIRVVHAYLRASQPPAKRQ